MTLTNASVTMSLSAKATPSATDFALLGKTLNQVGVIGGTVTINYSAANVIYAVKIQSTGGAGSTRTLTLTTGVITTGAGTATITGDAKDFSGVALPTTTKLYALRFTANAANTGVTTLVINVGTGAQTIILSPGEVVTLAYPSAGINFGGPNTCIITQLTNDGVTVEALTKI